MIALGKALRRYHDVVRAFDPGEEACWRVGCRALEPGEIVCHGDFAPWNTLWTSGSLVGIIDWDMAEPGNSDRRRHVPRSAPRARCGRRRARVEARRRAARARRDTLATITAQTHAGA